MASPNGTLAHRPPPGESTSRQNVGGFRNTGIGSTLGFGLFGHTLSSGSYETYRRMNKDPTLALARAVSKLPVKGAQHSFEADDGVPDAVVEVVQTAVDKIWFDLVDTMLWSLDFGWKSGELIWESEAGRLVPDRVKPLAVDDTVIMVDADTGSMLGVRQGQADLRWGKFIYLGNDVEDQNYYGVSRHENVRELVWGPWKDLMQKMAVYFDKGAGVIPVVRYPQGDGTDEHDSPKARFEQAQHIIQELSAAKGICVPFEMASWIQDAVRAGAKMDEVSAWSIDFLEARAGHGAEFMGSARYYDSLKMRGWLVPERAAIEGQMGTKAEASTHGDVGVGIAEELHIRICRAATRQVVDPILSYNFGPQMRGKVRIKAAPMVDESRQLLREVVTALLTNPTTLDVLQSTIDIDAIYDQFGVPKAQRVVDVSPAGEAPREGDDPDVPAKPAATSARDIAASMAKIHAALMRSPNAGRRRPLIMGAGPHKWACAYAALPEPHAAAVLAMAASIPDDQLAKDGRETSPHVTVKYGIGSDDPAAVRAVLEASPPVKVSFGQTSVFANPDGDVVKVDVYSDGLRALNEAIDKAVPHVDTHEWYQPHVTVAYVKPGAGQLFAGNKSLEGQEAVIDRVQVSDRMGRTVEVELKGAGLPSAGAA